MAGIEILDTLSDMGDTVKGVVGEKGLTLLIIGGVGFLVYSAVKKNGSFSMDSDDERNVVAIASYPDVGENSNDVIDTLQDSIQYSENNILAGMADNTIYMLDVIGGESPATNDYINDANNSILKKIDTQTAMIESKFGKTFDDLEAIRDVTNIPSNNTASGNTSLSTNYTGTSIVDALKSIGIYQYDGYNIGDYRSRINIAKANGIDNYTGTAEQNTALVAKLKNGNFVLPS